MAGGYIVSSHDAWEQSVGAEHVRGVDEMSALEIATY